MAVFVLPAITRLRVDGDEGYYALAAKLVARGKAPYASFWFQQAPLMPYVYASWDRLFGESWSALRSLSVAVTLMVGGLVYWHVSQRSSSYILGLFSCALFATTPLVFEWFPTIKTYALSTLFLFGAYLFAESASVRGWFAAGALLGLAIDTRLLFASVVIVFLLYARRHIGWLAVGLVTGLLPALWFFAMNPARFVYDTLASQTNRSHKTIGASIGEKIHVARQVFTEPHFLVLAVAAATLVVLQILRRDRISPAVGIAMMLALTSLVPTPSYSQYFSTLVPFLAVAMIELVTTVRASMPRRELRILTALVVVVTVSVAGAVADGVFSRHRPPLPSDIQAVSSAIDRLTRRGEVVISSWPGYVYDSHVVQLPGLESDFAISVLVYTRLSAGRAADYHMLSIAGLTRAIRSGAHRVLVFGRGNLIPFHSWNKVIAEAGYRQVERVRGVTIFLRASSFRASGR